MRYYTVFFFCLNFFIFPLSAQNLSHWQYVDGSLDSGVVKGLSPRTEGDVMIRQFSVRPDGKGGVKKHRLPYKPMAFLVEKGDTILIRRELEGSSRVLQKIYSGQLNLYRELSYRRNKRYYLKIEETYHPIHYRFTRHLIVDDHLTKDDEFAIPRRMTNSYQAIEFAHSMNSRLIPEEKRFYKRNYFLGRNRIGLAYNLRRLTQSYQRVITSASWLKREYYITHPASSLSYERQINKAFPWLYGQIQGRLFRENIDWEWRHPDSPPYESGQKGKNVREIIQATNIYIYPGLMLEFRQKHALRPVLGGGFALVQPLQFYRKLDVRNLSTLPLNQSLKNIQDFSSGHYWEVGSRFNFRRNFLLGLCFRWETLQQKRREGEFDIIESGAFPDRQTLAEEKQLQLQLQLQYSW